MGERAVRAAYPGMALLLPLLGAQLSKVHNALAVAPLVVVPAACRDYVNGAPSFMNMSNLHDGATRHAACATTPSCRHVVGLPTGQAMQLALQQLECSHDAASVQSMAMQECLGAAGDPSQADAMQCNAMQCNAMQCKSSCKLSRAYQATTLTMSSPCTRTDTASYTGRCTAHHRMSKEEFCRQAGHCSIMAQQDAGVHMHHLHTHGICCPSRGSHRALCPPHPPPTHTHTQTHVGKTPQANSNKHGICCPSRRSHRALPPPHLSTHTHTHTCEQDATSCQQQALTMTMVREASMVVDWSVQRKSTDTRGSSVTSKMPFMGPAAAHISVRSGAQAAGLEQRKCRDTRGLLTSKMPNMGLAACHPSVRSGAQA